MVAMCGLLHELPARNHAHNVKPLRLVRCMVKYPCSCCWLSVFISIVLTAVGLRVLTANAGPLGPFKVGVDYPNTELIARNSDALILAQEESALAFLGKKKESSGSAWGRRLAMGSSLDNDEDHDYDKMIDSAERLFGHEFGGKVVRHLHERRLATAQLQEQQSEMLTAGLLILGARDGVTNLYDDAGIDQICSFRKALMIDEPSFQDYCMLIDDPYATGSGDPTKVCSMGAGALDMFYGDADYDIDQIDVSDFSIAGFDEIVELARKQDMAALYGPSAAYPAADVTKVVALFGKITGYLMGPWTQANGKFACDASKKKNMAKTLAVIANIRAKKSLESYNGVLNQYFDKNFNVTNLQTRYTRATFVYGAPLAGYDNYIEQADRRAQDTKYQRWWAEKKFRTLVTDSKAKWPTMIPTFLNTKLLLTEILSVLIGDAIRALIPMVVVVLVVWGQTGSLFIALITLTEILLSLTTAIFVTTSLLQIKWVSFQCALSLYIVLAIGADDVFVFMDAYKQSFYKGAAVNESLIHRMSWVYRRAGLAMLITSLTTCAAFIASALSSPIPELQNFGIFAAFVIFIDYVLVMTFLCANTIIFHNHFEMKPGLCFACCDDCCCKEWRCSKGGCDMLCRFGSSEPPTSTQLAQEGKAATTKKPAAVRFFEDTFPFNLVVKRLPTRLVSIAICLGLLAVAISSAMRITPQTSTETFLPDDHPFQRYQTISNNEFETSNSDRTVDINFVWGFQDNDPLDQTGVSLIFDADFKGTPKYKSAFELTPSAQTALVDVCALLGEANATKLTIDTETGNRTINTDCFITAFRDYLSFKGEAFPLPTAAMATSWMETWLRDKDSSIPSGARSGKYENDVGWRKVDGSSAPSLSWVKMSAASKLGARAFLPATQTREYYNTWQDVLADVNQITASTPLGNAFQLSGTSVGRGNKWIYMTVQEAYVRMALVGAGVGLGIAALVLLLSTRNLIVTAACIGTIAAALACVLGTIVAMGWQLGSNESLCIMILTGFAVDYVVHLSHAYMESAATDRLERVHDALRDLGISVFWGMLTSLLAAVTLASCQIQSLAKFGVFFALTVSYSYLWSVFFLMPLLACVGPQPSKEGAAALESKANSSMAMASVGTLDITPTPPSATEMASAPPSPPGSASTPGSARKSNNGRVAPHIV